ncbi:hypothetical protein [Achromobacter xylosoxidans]|uniref:hypothetical protein n=1 Tax=Alcaligenes xylosoxydans xylosoxydans TaxID=85698 RepID=UPI001EEAC13E|nr:hypothetical protein [Achromobacter xylosoxidans]
MKTEFHILRLQDALQMLPNVQPNKARARIREWEDGLLSQLVGSTDAAEEVEPVEVAGETLTLECLEELKHDDGYSAATISPNGAQILMRLYRAGGLPMKGPIETVHSKLAAYAADNHSHRDLWMAENARHKAAQDSRHTLLSNPNSIPLTSLTEELVNEVFFFHSKNHTGVETMMISGVEVTRTVSKYISNSGKTSGYEVTLEWIGKNGQPVVYKRDTPFSSNRRNDAKRNWGLPD